MATFSNPAFATIREENQRAMEGFEYSSETSIEINPEKAQLDIQRNMKKYSTDMRDMSPGARLSACFFKACRNACDPFMMGFTIFLIIVIAYAMFFAAGRISSSSFVTTLLYILSIYITVQTSFNYICAASLPRLYPHEAAAPLPSIDAPTNLVNSACAKCHRLRPARTHHCSYCGVCSMKYDHHCPWVASCVSLLNYGHFVLFLAYATIGCLVGGFMGLVVFIKKITSHRFSPELIFVLIGCAMGLAMSLGTGMLLAFHIELLVTNQTTVEYYENQAAKKRYKKIHKTTKGYRSPYDMGLKENIWEVYGDNFWKKVLIPTVIRPPVSGFYWENKKNRSWRANSNDENQYDNINYNDINENTGIYRETIDATGNYTSDKKKAPFQKDIENYVDMVETQIDMVAKIEPTNY